MKITTHTEAMDYFDSFFDKMKADVEDIVSAEFRKAEKPMTTADLNLMISLAAVRWFRK